MSKLQILLDRMLEDARQHPQVPQKRKLQNGLHITVTVTANSVSISISRDETYPSENEWRAVCNHFPYYVGLPDPVKFVDSTRRYAMRANLPNRQQMALKLN